MTTIVYTHSLFLSNEQSSTVDIEEKEKRKKMMLDLVFSILTIAAAVGDEGKENDGEREKERTKR